MIRFDHVSKQYSGTTRPALNAINLEVLRGEFVFLVGASGSGKSSCLRLILKEEKPTKGKIHVLGQDVGAISSRKVPYFRRNIGVVFQDFRLLPNKSVFDNVAFTLQVIGKSRGFIQEAVPDVLKMVGLSGKASRLPHELSGGEQQRVAIARAVVNKPQVLLADEPTGNLDPATSAGIMAVLERINAGGTTVLMATHEAGIVDQMQRRVIELVSGQIVRDERHGGYGFTSAIPTTHVAVADASVDGVTRNTAPVRIPTHAMQDLHAAELRAEAAAAAPPVPAPTRSVPETPAAAAPVAPEQPAREPAAADPAAPADAAQTPVEPTTETARLSAHFAAPATQPVIRTQPLPDEDLPEQLGLAEKLGLRAPGDDQDITGEQNVGPTK